MNSAHHLKLSGRLREFGPASLGWEQEMRKRYRVLILAGIVVVLVVPFGLALSLESQPFRTRGPALGVNIVASASMSAPLIVGSSNDKSAWRWREVPDGVSLLGLGAALIGLAAAVRKTV
jgi:hypothetical protein